MKRLDNLLFWAWWLTCLLSMPYFAYVTTSAVAHHADSVVYAILNGEVWLVAWLALLMEFMKGVMKRYGFDDDIVVDLHGCARCDGDGHERLRFRKLRRPIVQGGEQLTHWARCPKTLEPILLFERNADPEP